jgi:hypothetical protein
VVVVFVLSLSWWVIKKPRRKKKGVSLTCELQIVVEQYAILIARVIKCLPTTFFCF